MFDTKYTRLFILLLAVLCLSATGVRAAEVGLEAPQDAYSIVWVSDNKNEDNTDQAWIDLLVTEGYDVNLDFSNTEARSFEEGEIDALNAADLIIISRDTNSGDYDDGNEPTEWNAITTPIIMQVSHIARSSRWLWLDTSKTYDAQPMLEAVLPEHPIFKDVALDPNNQAEVLTTLASFADTNDPGNGTLLAQSDDYVWIVEWKQGQEFYPGSGQIAGGNRLLFASGATPDETDGAFNLTEEGQKMFLNAVDYMIPVRPYTYDGDVAVFGELDDHDSLDGTWDHDNGSDQWEGTGPGEGMPGGVASLIEDEVTFLRVQDTGDPRDYDMGDPSNRKIFLTHDIEGGLDKARLEVRIRVATTGILDAKHPDGGDGVEPWPVDGIGYHIRDNGTGMFCIAEGDLGIISFSLARAGEPDFEDLTSDVLVMNNLVGAEPSGDVDTGDADSAVAVNMIAIDDASQWNTFVIDIAAGGAGTHVVTVSANGGLAESFDVTAGTKMESDGNHIAIGSSGTGALTAFDLDYITVSQVVEVPAFAEPVIAVTPIATMDATDDFGDILSIDGIATSDLIVGTTMFPDPPASEPQPPENADNFSLASATTADNQPYMETMFGQAVTTIFILEKSGNDNGSFQALDEMGNPVGNIVVFSPADFATTGYTGYGDQVAFGTVITSDTPIYGVVLTATRLPEEGGLGIDPLCICAIPAP